MKNKKVTSHTIDPDIQEWVKINRESSRFNLSEFIDKKLREHIPEADLLLIKKRRLEKELMETQQNMEKVDKYGATKI